MISAVRKYSDFRLAEHEASMARLSSVMRRTGAELAPEDFIEQVSRAFQEIQEEFQPAQAEKKFRLDSSFDAFSKALRMAHGTQRPLEAILVLGCGRGFAGKSAEFAARVVREVFGSRSRVEIATCDVSPALLRRNRQEELRGTPLEGCRQRYDLVVAHSLLHFIPDMASFFDMVRTLLRPAGGLILGHEPNARFWSNANCQAAVAELRQQRSRRRLSKYMTPGALLSQLRRGQPQPEDFWVRLNQLLAERYRFATPLSECEIRRIVDVHRPDAGAGDFRIGFNGFDLDQLSKEFLGGFSLAFSETSEHLGFFARRSVPAPWQRREKALAAENPQDGSVLTAYWARKAA